MAQNCDDGRDEVGLVWVRCMLRWWS